MKVYEKMDLGMKIEGKRRKEWKEELMKKKKWWRLRIIWRECRERFKEGRERE